VANSVQVARALGSGRSCYKSSASRRDFLQTKKMLSDTEKLQLLEKLENFTDQEAEQHLSPLTRFFRAEWLKTKSGVTA